MGEDAGLSKYDTDPSEPLTQGALELWRKYSPSEFLHRGENG